MILKQRKYQSDISTCPRQYMSSSTVEMNQNCVMAGFVILANTDGILYHEKTFQFF